MKPSIDRRSLTVRLPSDLYVAATDIARKRALSLNALVEEALTTIIRDAEEQARYDEYTLLGQDAEACDVEYAIHAQAEAMLRDTL